jgi:hypothetical protein
MLLKVFSEIFTFHIIVIIIIYYFVHLINFKGPSEIKVQGHPHPSSSLPPDLEPPPLPDFAFFAGGFDFGGPRL